MEMPLFMPLDVSALDFSDTPVALLAGGLATRLRPITHKIPKSMVEVVGRPFIDHQLELLADHGIRRVVLCLGHLGEQVAAHVGDGSLFGVEVQYAFDGEKLLGTGGALRRALPLLGRACWVLYGDSYLDIDYRAIFDAFARHRTHGLMTVVRNNNQWDRSNVVFQNGQLTCYDKHHPNADMHFIDFGAALLRREAIAALPLEQVCDLADLYHDLVVHGQMIGHEITHRFYEIGSPAGLDDTQRYLRAKLAPVD
jgi:NDP-sugar pyrophosphorylase family protein